MGGHGPDCIGMEGHGWLGSRNVDMGGSFPLLTILSLNGVAQLGTQVFYWVFLFCLSSSMMDYYKPNIPETEAVGKDSDYCTIFFLVTTLSRVYTPGG